MTILSLSLIVWSALSSQTASKSDEPINLVMAVSSHASIEGIEGAFSSQDFAAIEAFAKKLNLTVKRYPDGVMLVDGDPFDLKGRAGRCAIASQLAKVTTEENEFITVGQLSPSGKAEMGRLLDQFGGPGSHLGGIADKSSVPFCFEPSATIVLEAGGKRVQLPISAGRGTGNARPTGELPLAAGSPTEGNAKETGARPDAKGQFHFLSPPGLSGISNRTKLMNAYLKEVETESEALYAAWLESMKILAAAAGDEIPEKDKSFGALSQRFRNQVESRVTGDFKFYGFQSAQDAENFLARSRVSRVVAGGRLTFYVRLPNGNRSGASFPINP